MFANGRLRHLDGLRALAALVVVAQHTVESTFLFHPGSGAWAGWLVQDGFSLGRYGVAIFFIISGFLIPSSIGEGPGALSDFAVGRLFRLYPLYWASLLAALVLYPALTDASFSSRTVAANLTMAQPLFGAPHVIPLYWTLFVELVFYGLCAALVLIGVLHKPSTPLALVALAGGVMAVSSVGTLIALPAGIVSGLMKLGTFAMYLQLMFLGQVLRQGADASPGARPKAAVTITVLSLSVYCAVRVHTGSYAIGLTPLGVFSASAAAMATFLVAPRLAWLRSPLASFLGRISYGLYLFHPVVLVGVTWALPDASDWRSACSLMVLVVCGSSVVATAVHYWVERPGIAFGKRLRDLRSRRMTLPRVPSSRGAARQEHASV